MSQQQKIDTYEVAAMAPARSKVPVGSVPAGQLLEHGRNYNPQQEIRAFHRFHFRLTLAYGGAVMGTISVLVYLFYVLWSQSEIDSLQRRLTAVASSLAQTIDAERIGSYAIDNTVSTPFHREVFAQFQALAEKDPDIESIYILRPSNVPTELYFFVDFAKGELQAEPGRFYSAEETPILLKGFTKTVVEDQPYEDEFGITLSAYSPLITNAGEKVGLVGVDVKSTRLHQMRNDIFIASAVILLIALVVIALVSFVVARSIREPLRRLILGTGAVAQGNLDVRLGLSRADEFGLLGKYFDKMAEELKERQTIRDLFGRYLSEDVARSVLARNQQFELGGQEVVVTVLFCDLRDYTTISERLSPIQMVSMINEYLGVMNVVIDEHQGCVIEFLGDGILAVFGAPQAYPEHAENAVRCALAMRAALEHLNGQWEEQGMADRWKDMGIDRIQCRIGLHTGPVVAGNLGSKTRMKYAVIGDTVNVAARLEALNKEYNTTILMSDEVMTRLPNDLRESCGKVGITVVKGRQQTVVSYSI